MVWLGGGAAACAIVLLGAWKASRRKHRRTRRPERQVPPVRPSAANGESTKPVTATSPAVPPFSAAPQVPLERPASPGQPAAKVPPAPKPIIRYPSKAEALRKPLNGKEHGKHRRKVFDYNRYFSDLMGAVSGHSQMDMVPANEYPVEPGRFPAPSSGQEAVGARQPVTPDQQAELLATQRELIEEQKHLIQEQNKLIEEKSRLIAEKNELLKLQNRLINDKLL
jgi:hypothetical protein